MQNNVFNFCPECGSRNIQTKMNGRKWQCDDCGFDLYNNVASATGVILTNDRGEVLFEKRAKEPRKGFLALPGGFTNPDETAEQAVARECLEETGLKIKDVRYLCSFPNDYEYRSIHYKTCDLFFTAALPEGQELKKQEGEVADFLWKKIETVQDVENAGLAFESSVRTLKFWIESKQKNGASN